MSDNNKKIGLVTGAAGAIGSSIVEAILAQLDGLILVDINEISLQSFYQKIKNTKKKLAAIVCDVGSSESVNAMFLQAKSEVGIPNILINNAGIGGPFHRVDEVSDDEWYSIINTNLKSVFNLSRSLLPEMKKNQFGRIVNIASIQGYLGASLSSTYVASKHGVIGYTRAIAAEWGTYGITCNAICPGYVNTPMGAQDAKQENHRLKIIDKIPLNRIAEPDEIAHCVNYLISKEAGYISGSVITIDGGLSCHIGL